VIIKGTSCAGAGRLAVHLTRTDTNERVEVRDIRGVTAEDLRGALLEMEAVGAGVRAKQIFYHGSINPEPGEWMTEEQRAYAIDRLEKEMGLTGQPRIVVVHEKKDREHTHIVWSRIDLDRMAVVSDSNDYYQHEIVARALEREFGFKRVQGALIERDGKERPERTPSHREMLQAERTGVSPQQAKALMTGTWNTTKNGKQFQAALAEKGWILARGDRRDFVAIDATGGVHSIARRIDGAKAADVRERFADIDPRSLQSVAEARQTQRERDGGRDKERQREKQGEGQSSRTDQPRSAGQPEEAKTRRTAGGNLDWTNRGGMVAQQRSAMKRLKKADAETPQGTESTDVSKTAGTKAQPRTQTWRQRLRELSRESANDPTNEQVRNRGPDRSR
jgi:hypothetical protein